MPSNKNLALNLAALGIGMLLLAYASVPLYRLFCQVTGYGGTTRAEKHTSFPISEHSLTVSFNADMSPDLAWEFAPAEPSLKVHPGEQTLTHFTARNLTNAPITGRAVYNVTPFAAGSYFVKIECFCFKEQTLKPHEQVDMPVLFVVDPAIENDPDTKDIKTITLSYTFFPVENNRRKP